MIRAVRSIRARRSLKHVESDAWGARMNETSWWIELMRKKKGRTKMGRRLFNVVSFPSVLIRQLTF